jgi:uroporphyrinogen decarboxylase
MQPRERFRQICRFERTDDPFFWHMHPWNATLDRWVCEGMPVANLQNLKETHTHFLGFQDQKEGIAPNAAISGFGRNSNPPWVVALDPLFERRVLADDGVLVTLVDYDGTVVQRRKEGADAIPHYLEYPVVDRATWRAFKKRLDPHSPGRWPEGWEIMSEDKLGWPIREGQAGQTWEARDFPLGMIALSLYGCPRNYMGLQELSIAMYDDPLLVEEMVEWQAYLSYEMVKRVFDSGITLDWVAVWEDMCYNHGSLVSPRFVSTVMVPRYRRVVDLLRAHGVEMILLDCDGNMDELLPIWLDCGINAFYPFERAAGMDPLAVRSKYGKNIILTGCVDKRALAQGKPAIDQEIEMVQALLKSGGYFPSADHMVPPDVPYENAVYFVNEVRKLSTDPETRRMVGDTC